MESSRGKARAHIVEVAARLLRERGAGAVTIRAVAQAADTQAPTIYRFFEDKDALLDAVAEHVFAEYVATKATTEPGDDPLADLRAGWDTHLGFGLANPDLVSLLTDPARAARSPAMTSGMEVLRARVHRVAAAGRLRVTERRAVELLHAAGTGAVLTLLSTPPQDRDPGLADAMFETVMRSVLDDEPPAAETPSTATDTVRRCLPELRQLTEAERTLLGEWLTRP
ncbi:helix-turn-helix domain-containing protein [Lentzea sp. BCCO 10_0798]|uniref:Helix-turn-helix domain-containing protein n=1 Tax=Lentzea kristufekii TaxID=3095430 RepID=A0ABU4TRD1_9PSEU|nr:helix-turn-helix domain-containing protein [Lentzea sp. BCCO 10_0798]MDX8050855.1 helix-turn-helix domain-containing protein [Lentzea sp. BCCO 10_0798]